ncbi:cyanate MFS transporter [Streptomyces griseoflavus Tu4000]|uniref:Cyanate MFS transporter n=1 Tax=Streptomyces griseoflavus Tu4000 TaxID=467200 RepID=D9XRG5_9ACTN|nr:cyanate MFS transporter [Streptomyces griseoflavus Tu4000]
MTHLRTTGAPHGGFDMDSQSSNDSMMVRMAREETRTLTSTTVRTPAPHAARTAPGTPAARRPWRTRLLVIGIVLAALNLRPAITSLGALLEEVRDGLGMSGSVAGLLTSVPPLCFAVFGVTAPRLARRFGAGAVVCAGMVAIGAGLLIRPYVGGTAAFLAASALALMGIAVSNVLMPVIVKRWFPDRVGSMTGLYSMALALGTATAAAATVPLTGALGGNWQSGLAVWAALAVAAVLPWIPFVRGGDRQRDGAHGARTEPATPADAPPAAHHPQPHRLGRWPSSSGSRPPPPTSPWAGWRRSSGTRACRPAPPGCSSR